MNYREPKRRVDGADFKGRPHAATTDTGKEHAGEARYGATPEEWLHFREVLGLTEHLLPTVANPYAKPSPGSKIKSPAKVPTIYNRSRQYHGIAKWSERHSTASEVRRWSQEPDYGICLQARAVRGLDIDIDDPVKAKLLIDLAESHFGPLPQRFRNGCGRALIPFLMDGPLPKRSVRVTGGVVEILGDGNQFVVAGRHPRGARYEWRGGLPRLIPAIDPVKFEEFWSDVEMFHGTGDTSTCVSTPRQRAPNISIHDRAADYLRAAGLVLHERPDGGFNVECPWAAQHSSGEPGDGSTTYFPAGTNGHKHGAFKCFHQSHGERRTREFLRAVGYVDEADTPEVEFAGLDDVADATPAEIVEPARLTQVVPLKRGKGAPSLSTIASALRKPGVCGKRIGLDSFLGEIMLSDAGDRPQWREITDVDNTRLREHLQRVHGLGSISRDTMRDVLEMVAEENRFDSARLWLSQLQWDGTSRVDSFLCRYFGCTETPYTRALSRYIWTALSGRVMAPGCKADMVPVAVGKQGTGKSRAIAAMAPSPEMFGELTLDLRDADTARRLRGKLVTELPELSGLSKRDSESLKALLSAVFDEWVPKYKERSVRHPRRLIFFGSSNRDDFLVDETGHRRWLPFRSGQCDPEALTRDRDQLWAEGRVLYVVNGVEYCDAERLAQEEHGAFTEVDPWTDTIAAWLDGRIEGLSGGLEVEAQPQAEPQSRIEATESSWIESACGTVHNVVTTSEVLVRALHFSKAQINRSQSMRVARILRQLGWQHDRRQVDGSRKHVFVRPGTA